MVNKMSRIAESIEGRQPSSKEKIARALEAVWFDVIRLVWDNMDTEDTKRKLENGSTDQPEVLNLMDDLRRRAEELRDRLTSLITEAIPFSVYLVDAEKKIRLPAGLPIYIVIDQSRPLIEIFTPCGPRYAFFSRDSYLTLEE